VERSSSDSDGPKWIVKAEGEEEEEELFYMNTLY